MLYQGKSKILVKRAGAFGDVVSITPIMRRLRKEHPDAVIHVETHYPEIFVGNEDVNAAFPIPSSETYSKVFDLNGSYERRQRAVHGIDCYMEDVFGDTGGDKSLKVCRQPLPPQVGTEFLENCVTIHPATSWQNRTMPTAFWQGVADHLKEAGFAVATVGTARDQQLQGVVDLRGFLTCHQQAEVCHRSRCFIGSDCGGLFLAGATDVPIVALFTTSPESMNIIWRRGEPNWRLKPIVPDLPCVGCTTRFAQKAWPEILTYHGCERDDFACVYWFKSDEIARYAIDLAHNSGHLTISSANLP
ncbi:MAG TPA: glycosyltransferase family 9 protein [Candidatus Angelobacter sp.]|nr:glycosyltransferase family 9 protein [Candidatus Angelobacter sp.]